MEKTAETINFGLSQEEISKILATIKDERLRADESPEYFTIHSRRENKVISIPKRKEIFSKNGQENGRRLVQTKKIEDVLRETLEKLDQEEGEDHA